MARDGNGAANVAAIVAIAPGPPANLQPVADPAEAFPEDAPSPVVRENALKMWANSERFPHRALETYLTGLVPESPRALNERNNVNGGGLRVAGPAVASRHSDPRHYRRSGPASPTRGR